MFCDFVSKTALIVSWLGLMFLLYNRKSESVDGTSLLQVLVFFIT